MSTFSRRGFLTVLALLLCVGASVADPATGTAVDAAQLFNALSTEIAKSLKAQADDLKAERAGLVRQRENATGEQRQDLARQIQDLDGRIAELTSEQKRAEGNKAAMSVSSGLLKLYQRSLTLI